MLDAQNVSLELISVIAPLVRRVARHDRDLSNQMRRAASSIGLNAGEGASSDKGNTRARFSNARGSASETLMALKVAVAWGYLAQADIAEAVDLLDRLGAMLYRLSAAGR